MKKTIILIISVWGISARSYSQGCSDAGVCTIRSVKNNTLENDKNNHKNDLAFGIGFGKGERSISYYSPFVEYTRTITQKTSVTGKIGYSFIQGELADTRGINDLFLSVNHSFDANRKWKKSFVIGIKIPFDGADLDQNGINLPMPYQPSLGTTDLVAGINFMRASFGGTIALQQPLSNRNMNRFLPENYPSEPLAEEYLPSNSFNRKGDLLGRVSYDFRAGSKFYIRPSLLGIYHLSDDSYIDKNKARREIEDSKGLTFNGNIFVGLKTSGSGSIELSLGAPFIVRENRPDGLTRSFVAAIEYSIGF